MTAAQTAGLEVKHEPYRRQSFPDGLLDFVYCYHTLEHLPQPYAALGNFYWHLKPGGHLYVEVPNVKDTQIYQLGFGHLCMFSPGTLCQSLMACGFEILYALDRSRYPTFGMGVLCRKPAGCEHQQLHAALDGPFLSPHQLEGWRKDRWLTLRWRLWYAFHIGRGQEALTWRAPLRIGRFLAKRLLRPMLQRRTV